MAVQRVYIKSDAANPFKVSVAGVDAQSANFTSLLFDGNQQPLRLYSTGYVVVGAVDESNLAPAIMATGPAVMATPAGLTPLFCVNGRNSGLSGTTPPVQTVISKWQRQAPTYISRAGFGGVIANNTFYGINFSKEYSPFGPIDFTAAVIAFCCFRNYG